MKYKRTYHEDMCLLLKDAASLLGHSQTLAVNIIRE